MKRLYTLFFCGTILFGWLGSAHATKVRIQIPDVSGMTLVLDRIGFADFEGELTLHGQLLLRSEHKATDVIDGVPADFEWRVSLLFRPDPAEREKLPRVHYPHERNDQELWIALDFFKEKKLASSIATIFGADIAAKIGKDIFEISKQGYLRLTSYSTNVECDRRYHYAETVAFEIQHDALQAQARRPAEKTIGGCSF